MSDTVIVVTEQPELVIVTETEPVVVSQDADGEVVVITEQPQTVIVTETESVVVSENGAATTAIFQGEGSNGLVPDPGTGADDRVLRADGTWGAQSGGGGGGPGSDTTAIHDNVSAEISAITEKVAPVNADLIIIEDSAAGNAKKKVQLGNLPFGSGTDEDAIHDNVAGEIAAVALKSTPAGADHVLIEDSADSNNKKRTTAAAIAASGPPAAHAHSLGDITGVGLLAALNAVTSTEIANNAVTNTKLADMDQNRIKGRVSAGSGDPEDLTAAQVRTMINVEDGATADQTGAEIKAAYEAEPDTNAFTDAEKSKLGGIETGATADQTAGEIKTLYESNADTNAFTDADESKLDGIEALADVTDAANVAAAGAVMDSDFSPAEGFMRKTGAGTYTAIKSNLTATIDPGTGDDSDDGYAVGSVWINVSGDSVWTCVDATVGAAVWKDLSSGVGSHTHTLADITDSGALAALDTVGTTEIDNDAVTNAKLANMAQALIKGRAAGAGTGDPTDLTAAQVRAIINVEDGAAAPPYGTSDLSDEAVTFAKMQHIAQDRVLGRASAGSGDVEELTGAQVKTLSGCIANIVEDTTPQLGGHLDVNGQVIGDGTRELLTFVEDASAVNHLQIENQATGNGPILRATGDDTNVDLHLDAKGTGKTVIDTDEVDFQAHSAIFDETNNTPSSGSVTINWKNGNKQRLTLDQNATSVTFTAPSGPATLLLVVEQNDTGGYTVTWPASVKWPSGTAPTLSTPGNSIDVVSMYYDGTNYYASTLLDFN